MLFPTAGGFDTAILMVVEEVVWASEVPKRVEKTLLSSVRACEFRATDCTVHNRLHCGIDEILPLNLREIDWPKKFKQIFLRVLPRRIPAEEINRVRIITGVSLQDNIRMHHRKSNMLSF